MRKTGRRGTALIAVGAGLTLVLTACGANSSGGGGGAGSSSPSAGAGGGAKVGVVLPDTASSARYESFDRPLLDKALRAEGLDPDIQNAQGDVQKFSALADGMINNGVKVLILDAPNTDVGAAVEKKAQAAGIPTIDYDRLNLGGSSDYYVSFDNTKVG
ncbi:MAG: D-xylose transport system substrate-binding protein, partial [Pseudonocardiales bacterium]|nr:D-xylose transport system substrate-binding protein [Pseudonocardiales bacterium]